MNKLIVFATFLLLAVGTSMLIAPAASAQDVVVEERSYSVSTDDPADIDDGAAVLPDEEEAILDDDEDEMVLDDDYDGDTTVVAETVISDGDDAVERCAARYRSFDPATGTYLGYDGLTHPCPYLP